MKMCGGYLPRIVGRPSSTVRPVPVPDRLFIDLRQHGLTYTPAVPDGTAVALGAPLAWADVLGGRVALPAPAPGTVTVQPPEKGSPGQIHLAVTGREASAPSTGHEPARTTAATLRDALAKGGVWPLIWSSTSNGMPPLDGSEMPGHILVNGVISEPFRARGRVVLRDHWASVGAGLTFLQRLMADYGVIHLVLTDLADPVAAAIRRETAGQAWVRVEDMPVRYPVEHPRVLCRALRRADRRVTASTPIWVLDVQAAKAVGACLASGRPLIDRVVAIGGPGASEPTHAIVRVGTRLDALLPAADRGPDRRIIRGGIMRGKTAEATSAVGFGDDAFFILPRPAGHEFLAFLYPGIDRTAFLPCFLSALGRGVDRQVTTSLRGERRPCIACGLCEDVCPVGLMPQILLRRAVPGGYDEAAELGLDRCIACGACSYVCPSKLELAPQFAAAQSEVQKERAETAAALAEQQRREASRECEKAAAETWKK